MGELDKFDAEKVEAVANKLALMKLPLIETPNLAVEKIRAQARRWKKKGLDVLIIDYLQIMDESGISKGDRNRMQEVSHMTKTLKNMAKDLDILVIALAQVNRQSEEKRTPPGLHNLRESGSIEQDADIVLFVHPEEEPQEGAVSVPYKLICAKQRNGPLFKKDFKYLPRIVTFKEV
jgi:Replicative DNA helicase